MTQPPAPSFAQVQDKILVRFGNTVAGRSILVGSMLRRDASEATSYWFQLLVSMGIATLGLVVGSAAVVIGAMLVAPLMGPIVGLAMGLATGSPFLVLRSGGRILASVCVVIVGASLITLLLPFHELNAEIAARTAPTLLDLITAAFCALAGVYATLRASSDTTTTAAGTSISISLVPPLCASGYGVGTSAWNVAGGAALLFLTNLVAIVVVGSICFVAAGFNQVDAMQLERTELGHHEEDRSVARFLARKLSRLFESKLGPALRFLMPFTLVAAVYVPLRRALDEVAWQVRARASVRDAIARDATRIVQSRVRVERHEVEIALVVLGTTVDADAAHSRLDVSLRQSTGVTPRIEIYAVPDANAFAGLESTLLAPLIKSPPSPVLPTPDEQLSSVSTRIRTEVDNLWPKQTAGEPLVIDVGTANEAPLRIRIVHLGPALGPDALETIRLALITRLSRPISIVDGSVPLEPLTRSHGDLAFIAQLAEAIRDTASVPALNVCVRKPSDPSPGRRLPAAELELNQAIDPLLAQHPKVAFTERGPWRVQFTTAPCSVPESSDAGVPDASTSP